MSPSTLTLTFQGQKPLWGVLWKGRSYAQVRVFDDGVFRVVWDQRFRCEDVSPKFSRLVEAMDYIESVLREV